MKIRKVFKVMKCKQKELPKPSNDLNTDLTTKAEYKLQENFRKSLNSNQFFKFMEESVERKRMVTTGSGGESLKLQSKITFDSYGQNETSVVGAPFTS